PEGLLGLAWIPAADAHRLHRGGRSLRTDRHRRHRLRATAAGRRAGEHRPARLRDHGRAGHLPAAAAARGGGRAAPGTGRRRARGRRGTMTAMSTPAAPVLDPRADIAALTAAIVDIESVSGNERQLADAVEHALRVHAGHLEVHRDGDTVIARTDRGLPQRVLLAGHLDTVPLAVDLPSTSRVRDGREELVGRGTCDVKGGDAVLLKLAVEAAAAPMDLTWIFYDHEEVAAADNALTRIAAERPELLEADFAILGEPTSAGVEGGCKGTMKLEVTARGVAAHSARDWVGDNAVHRLAPVLERLAAYEARRAVI